MLLNTGPRRAKFMVISARIGSSNRANHRLEIVVARRCGHSPMEVEVGIDSVQRRFAYVLHSQDRSLDHFQLLGRHVRRRQRGSLAFQYGPHFEHVAHRIVTVQQRHVLALGEGSGDWVAAETNTPTPWRDWISPCARSVAIPSRTTFLLTPKFCDRNCSVGKRSPGRRRPDAISSLNERAMCSAR